MNVRRRVSAAILAVFFAMAGALLAGGAQSRDLDLDPDDLVPVELSTVVIDPRSGQPVVLLREPDSGDVVLISVGPQQARSIVRALQGEPTRRPMTHDLMRDVIEALDAELVRVMIDRLSGGIYHGILELGVAGGGDTVRVDTRPSDGLALAARTDAEIRVARELLSSPDSDYRGYGDEEVVNALGITVVEATPELREALELPDMAGVLVSRATGEAAAAGMAPGSLILTINGDVPESPLAFLEAVRSTPAGDSADIVFWQAGEEHEVSLDTAVPREPRRPQRGIEL